MTSLFSGNSMWYLVRQSDAMTIFVLLMLLGMSVLCWTVFLYKFFLFRIRISRLRWASRQIAKATTTDELEKASESLVGTLTGLFLRESLAFLKWLGVRRTQVSLSGEQAWKLMERETEQQMENIVAFDEMGLPILSTCAAVSPLLGLFGTVWGLVHAFMGISQQQTADIAAVAPGISQALITTLVGLIVAIPALIMYNYLSSQLRTIENLVMRIGDKVLFVARHALVG